MSPELIEKLNFDALPFDMAGRRVTEIMDLTGRVAAVTAGGGPSLGQACVNRLAGLGAKVAVIDIDGAAAERVAKSAAERWGVDTLPIAGDMTRLEDAQRAVRGAADHFGRIDVWVNNLGIPDRGYRFPHATQDELDRSIAINFLAPVYCSRAVLDVMLPQKRGRIINIASESSKRATAISVIYSSCKAGVVGFTRNLALELKGAGVTTVAVCPGVMLTPEIIEVYKSRTEESAQALLNGINRVIAGRASLAEEVANMVAFLATDAGAYVQATAVSVGGGLSD
jgi:3-oxoacyl-[acyl-carrier protein] reductase